MPRALRPRAGAVLMLAGITSFWAALLVAASLNPQYSHRRDYISSLAARGVEQPWLGMLAIAAVGAASVGAAVLVRPLTRSGAAALLAAGVGYVVVALARVDCPNGAARCGLGGRFDVEGTGPITHWTAAVVSTLLVLIALVLVGTQLLRRRRRLAAAATLAAAAVTCVALVGTGGQAPGTMQRIWVVVMTTWLVGAAVWALGRSRRPGARGG